MPNELLYGVISFLGLAVITLTGLWVKSHDNHRQWSVEKINEHERVVAVLQETHRVIERDMGEIKDTLKAHLALEEEFQRIMIKRMGVEK